MSTDSLETSVMSTQLFPNAANIVEHHRVLNLSASAHERHLTTFKAHKVRIDDLDERIDDIKEDLDQVDDLRTALAKTNDAMSQFQMALSSHGSIVGQLSQKIEDRNGKAETRRAIISGTFALLIAIVSALGGYWMHPSGGPSYQPPTHQQAVQIDQQTRANDPENLKRIHEQGEFP